MNEELVGMWNETASAYFEILCLPRRAEENTASIRFEVIVAVKIHIVSFMCDNTM
jgi:hypothetical protein